MHIYSNNIIKFRNDILSELKFILAKEVGVKVAGDRFYDLRQQSSYPLKVVIFNNKSLLGYFNAEFYELGFHERLMHVNKQQQRNIIKHELAHYLTFINHGPYTMFHGAEFRDFCRRMGWGEDVYSAKMELDATHDDCGGEENAILRKVKKLMALSTSSNSHEAEQAMIKSQQLLLTHNIEAEYIGDENDEKMFLKRIMRQKKENAKLRAIARILETFFVSTVYARTEGFIHLEILGSAVNIEIAEYVAAILDGELDRLWEHAKQQYAGLKGQVAKNSFFSGIAKGYCTKIDFLKREHNSDTANALMVIEKKLCEIKAAVYKRLSYAKSQGHHCQTSAALGEMAGRQLKINPGLSQAAKSSDALLSYSS